MASLRVGFADYELVPVENGNPNLIYGNQICVGLVDHYGHEIFYRDDLSGQAQLQTLLHEAIHCADFQAGDMVQGEQRENDIDRYANFMMQFVRDNREFVKLIWEVADRSIVKEVKKKPVKAKAKK